MLVYLIIFLMFICSDMKIAEENSFNRNYLNHDSTLAVNGIFVVLVFFSHCTESLDLSGVYDGVYVTLKKSLLQMVVVPFLFYSGFGIMESIKNKEGYVKSIPKNRFLKVLVHFDIAVLLYLVLQYLLGQRFGFKRTILALVGWVGVGNSNWYIFVMLVLYIMVFVAFIIPIRKARGSKYILGITVVIILSLFYIWTMIRYEVPTRFYNTILLFPFGMLYSVGKEKIEKVCMKNDLWYTGSCIITFIAYYYCYCHAKESIVYYSAWGITFMMLVLLFTMKISLKNHMLIWLGKNVFGIYILQRIPMIILKNLNNGIYVERKYVFIISCFIATLFITVIFNSILKKVDMLMFKKKSDVSKGKRDESGKVF